MRGIDVRKKSPRNGRSAEWQGEDEYSITHRGNQQGRIRPHAEEYKKHKGLDQPSDNLRDHMSDLELIFNMLGEAATTEIAQKRDIRGFEPNKKAAVDGGNVAAMPARTLKSSRAERSFRP